MLIKSELLMAVVFTLFQTNGKYIHLLWKCSEGLFSINERTVPKTCPPSIYFPSLPWKKPWHQHKMTSLSRDLWGAKWVMEAGKAEWRQTDVRQEVIDFNWSQLDMISPASSCFCTKRCSWTCQSELPDSSSELDLKGRVE